jgi:hypothetical protein
MMTDIPNGRIGGSLDELALSDLEPTARVQAKLTGGERDAAPKERQRGREVPKQASATEEEIEEFEGIDQSGAGSGGVETVGHKVDRLA